ncbi:MAG: helicase C-terminal domain-containing protein [Myxococcota bacterium]
MLPVKRRDAASLGFSRQALGPWLDVVGPVAIVDLETTGLPTSRSAEIIEIGLVLLDPDELTVGVASTLLRPRLGVPPVVSRLTGLVDQDLRSKPTLSMIRDDVRELLGGRLLVAHQVDFERSFLERDIDAGFGSVHFLDTQEILAFTHPDAPDLRLETFTRLLLGREERHRALEDAIDAASVLAALAEGAQAGVARYREAGRILARHLAESPWGPLLSAKAPKTAEASADFVDFARQRAKEDGHGRDDESGDESEVEVEVDRRFLQIGESAEEPVPFEIDALLSALKDQERGERHFPGYRVRAEQLELTREFFRVLADGGIARLEGGTGVGKSLAYLTAAIPFAMAQAAEGAKQPVVLSTRTKLLQDQLLRKDIAAAARFLGYPELRALSIKGRANYICERRLAASLAEAHDPGLRPEVRGDYALLEACARLRPNGEVGTVPAALVRQRPRLRELLRASVASRAEHCSREQCAFEPSCPFGQHRKALGKAHLIVANHDLLLRWPPDYPNFSHVIMDEGHEVGGVAEEVYALRVRPEELSERLDELFGQPAGAAKGRYATSGLVAAPKGRTEEMALSQNRRDLRLELAGLGRTMAGQADSYGSVELSATAGTTFPTALELSEAAATRLEFLASLAEREGPARRTKAQEDSTGQALAPGRDDQAEEEAGRAIGVHAEALRTASHGLRTAFEPDNDDYVGAFEGLETPFDRWSLVLRPVAPGEAFRAEFLGRVESLAVVSATLFVGGDDYAALGEVGLGEKELPDSWSCTVGSPFPYAEAMRVVPIESDSELVEETAQTLAVLARTLGGRTLGLFTSLARMRETADRLTMLLAGEGIEILLPRRAGDDPGALVERFHKAKGGAVLLGARRFWQGIDVRGDGLQAVVIEKLPFDVPTELRRRREVRLREAGDNPFVRASLGRMLLHLKQMVGRLIRSETDRGIVVIVDARQDRSYFRRLPDALPDGMKLEIAPREALPGILRELGLGR